jgi:hypothetical protein
VLGSLVSADSGCRLTCLTFEEREELPPSLFTRHAFGIVRRGLLIRQRCQPSGEHTAIDAAGPGGYVPLSSSPGSAGYASSRVLLCVYPTPRFSSVPGEEQTALDLLRLLEETLARVERLAEARGQASAAERLRVLSEALTEWLGPQASEHLLQSDMAALLGIRKETVCRLLRAGVRHG